MTYSEVMPAPTVIELDSVSLNLPLPKASRRVEGSKDAKVGGVIFEDGGRPFIRVLQNVSLKIASGERVGVIGHNGAGKSSLLRLIAGIYSPSAGTCRIAGKPSCLFSTSIGLHQDTTVRENIGVALSLYGVPRRELTGRSEEILQFADMTAFAEMPLGACSSGMKTRLGFAIVTSITRSILLIDEVVSTGDASFQRKSKERIRQIVDQAGALVMTTHSLGSLEEYCERGVWLDRGRIAADGPMAEVLKEYRQHGMK